MKVKKQKPDLGHGVLKLACEKIDDIMGEFHFWPMCLVSKKGTQETLFWNRITFQTLPDQDWIVSLWSSVGLDCRTTHDDDGVAVRCYLRVNLVDTERLIDSGQIMKKLRPIFDALGADEVPLENTIEHKGVYCQEFEVTLDGLQTAIERIIGELQSANERVLKSRESQ